MPKALRWTVPVALMVLAASANAGWQYDEVEDPMTGKKTQEAWIVSTNSMALGSPYEGKNYGRLMVRRSPRNGVSAVLVIDKGQMMCNHYDGCNLLVRFDDAPPINMHGIGSADHSPEVGFFSDHQRFISLAKKAKRIRISATIYQNGQQMVEFNAAEPLKDFAAPSASKR